MNKKIKLPALIGDGMVLQQNSDICLWGNYNGQADRLQISASWLSAPVEAPVADGHWQAQVHTPAVDHLQHTIRITAPEEDVVINNVMLGEVWFGGGQSNMEMPLEGFWRAPVEGSNREIAESGHYPQLRCFMTERGVSDHPQEAFSGQWETASPNTLPKWSAMGWFFMKHLHLTLGVPVGMIVSAWGGTKIEAWMSKEDLLAFDDVDYTPLEKYRGTVGTADMTAPYLMYYGMIRPLRRYTIRGFIFDQGASNLRTYPTYARKMAAMVARWREDFGNASLPFYYAEVAPYVYDPRQNGRAIYGALIREAQQEAESLIPHSQMVCTNDLVDEWERLSVHPSRKEPVGERMAWCALNHDYGYTSICCTYPRLQEARFGGHEAIVRLRDSEGLTTSWDEITNSIGERNARVMYYLLDQLRTTRGFEVAGEDRIFHPAQITGLGDDAMTFLVSSDEVDKPVAVRYCFHDYEPGNLYNQRGMPTLPFRSDRW